MIIYVWPDGFWKYSWEATSWVGAKKVDLDRWYDYDLSDLEVLACLETLEE